MVVLVVPLVGDPLQVSPLGFCLLLPCVLLYEGALWLSGFSRSLGGV